MRNLFLLITLAFSAILSGCSQKGDCNALQTRSQFWDRIIEETQADTVFQNPRFPLDAIWGNFGSLRSVEVYRESPAEGEHQSVMDSAPLHIDLHFRPRYTAAAAAHWQEDGFIGAFPNGGIPLLELVHEVRLSLPALVEGTYAFGPLDTADGLTVELLGFIREGPNNGTGFRPDSAQISGYIRIEKSFTSKSGAFSYSVKARYLSGQVSVFSGSGNFKGFSYSEDCSM